jgi:hypothetical protein
MRKTLIALIACTGLLLGVSVTVPVSASAQGYYLNPYVIPANAQYVCDGASQGSCASLPVGGGISDGANLYAIGFSGAWRWDVVNIGTVNGDFAYGPINNALNGQDILQISLLDESKGPKCLANSSGDATLQACNFNSPPRAQQWVAYPAHDTLVNIGRSNDKDNWEILCNPGGGNHLIVTTRDACTTYHEQWGSVYPV